MTAASVDVSRLGPMDELDAGAFGTVHRLSSYALPGFVDLAYKEFSTPPRAEEVANLTALVAFRSGADATTRAILDDAAAWPLQLVTRHGSVCGFLMQLIPPEFFGQQVLPSGRTVHLPVKSQWLVVDPAKADAAGIAVARADDIPARLVLCAKLAHVFGVLHRAGFVYGDLSLNNVMFSAATPPRVMLVDCDAVKAPGVAPITQAHTPDWTPPECLAGVRAQDIATDCYKLALFILRTLTPGPHASQATDPSRVVGVLDLEGNTQMRDAVCGDRSKRASAKGWYDYLTRYLRVLTSPPEFTAVSVDTRAAMAGAMVTVSWQVAGADRVVVTASDGYQTSHDASAGTGQCRIAVTRTGPFTLTAENCFGTSVNDTRPVYVLEPPMIARIDVPSIGLPPLPTRLGEGEPELAHVLAGIRPELPGSRGDWVAAPDLAAALSMTIPSVPSFGDGWKELAAELGRGVDDASALLAAVAGDVRPLVDDVRTASAAAVGLATGGIGSSR